MQTPTPNSQDSSGAAITDGFVAGGLKTGTSKRLGKPPAKTGELKNSLRTDTAHETSDPLSLDHVYLELQRLLANQPSRESLIASLIEMTAGLSNAMWSGHFEMDGAGTLRCSHHHNAIADQNLGIHQSSLFPTAQRSFESQIAQVTTQDDLTVVAVPVLDQAGGEIKTDGCFCIALHLGNATAEPFLLMLQLIAATMGQFLQQQKQQLDQWKISATAAIAELMSQVALAKNRKPAAIVATNELANFLNASVVAIGFCSSRSRIKTRIMSISGSANFDIGGKHARLLQSAMDESLVRGGFTSLPAIEGDDRAMKLAHQRLLESHPNQRLVSSPLITSEGETIGAWVCVLPDEVQTQTRTVRFADCVGTQLADALHANRAASAGVCKRAAVSVHRFFGGNIGRMVAAAIAATILVLCVPVTHRVACDCQLQPTERRFAVAPFQGILLESFVKPGDMVSAGQTIAIMDDRELVLTLADLTAQRETARKKRDVNRSARDAAATQIAELEIEQLDAQIRLAEYRQASLTICSPVDGVVLQGELENAQGAPVRTGDVLVEVSPLATLKLELNVAEFDLDYVSLDQPVDFSLEGTPFQQMQGSIERIHPASEIRDNQNVFVSEFTVDNENQQLRPGMQGNAKVNAGKRSLGWVLFHRPAQRLYSIFR